MSKGVGLPLKVLVGIVLAVIIIAAALVMTGIIPIFQETQTYQGAFQACCISYSIAGHCEEGAANPGFECMVAPDLDPDRDGKMKISELAGRVGVPVEKCCG